jgi:hypothetical protein
MVPDPRRRAGERNMEKKTSFSVAHLMETSTYEKAGTIHQLLLHSREDVRCNELLPDDVFLQ